MNQEQYQEVLLKNIMDNLDDMQELIEVIRDDLQMDEDNKAYNDTELLQRISVATIGLISGMVTLETVKETGGFE